MCFKQAMAFRAATPSCLAGGASAPIECRRVAAEAPPTKLTTGCGGTAFNARRFSAPVFCQGFSLVELTVVLLLITLIASVAVRETSELGFQVRYDQTKDRLEMIKQAILGNPRQIVNGQQAISGFVADMGRLPYTLRELLEDYDCDGPDVDGNGDTNFTNDGPCPWALETTYNSGLGIGWRGPYLSVLGNATDLDAFTDGWGRTSNDGNYGWRVFDWDSTSPTLPSTNTINLIIQSLGKDQQSDTSMPVSDPNSYDNDYPPNMYEYTAATGSYYPQPLIRQQDWKIDISGGISVSFVKTSRALPISYCSDPSKSTKATCLAPEIWYGLCDKAGFYNKDSCTAATGNWGYCSDGASTTEATCTSPSTWSYCSDRASINQPACVATTPPGIWETKGYGCSDQTYVTKDTCESNGKTWYGCTDGSGVVLASCTTAWFVSTNETSILPTMKTPICMKVFYRKPDSTIGVLISDGNLSNDTDGNVKFDPNIIIADGSIQAIRFTNFRDSETSVAALPIPLNIAVGSNAIGIYQYDGTSCKTSTLLYPNDRQNPIPVEFHPHSTLPVINW